MRLLLDTNIALTMARRNVVANNLEQEFRFFTDPNTLLISAVTLGELESIVLQNSWGARKRHDLDYLLSKFVTLAIRRPKIIKAYAKIDAFSQGKPKPENPQFSSRNMGKNDLWIAATANVYDLHVFTTNGDFDHLAAAFVNLTKVDLSKFV